MHVSPGQRGAGERRALAVCIMSTAETLTGTPSSVFYHEARADFVDRERLQGGLQEAKPLQPAQHRKNVVQMHEEARICHLIEGRQGGDQNDDIAVAEQTGKEEVLRVIRLQLRVVLFGRECSRRGLWRGCTKSG